MENKYYTPTIEELHPGFELELNGKGVEGLNWFKRIVEPDDIILYAMYIDPKRMSRFDIKMGIVPKPDHNIRVKYLDKEDIASLGWEFIKIPYRNNIIRKLKKEYLDRDISKLKEWELDECYYYMDYNVDTNQLVIHNGQEYSSSYVWFDGIIKNKSELKILLKQLGI